MRRRSNINLKLIAQMLGKAGFNHIITVDMHSKESQGFFDSAIDNLRASPFLIQYIQESVSNKILKWHFSFLWCILFIFFKLKFSELQVQDHMNSPKIELLIPSPTQEIRINQYLDLIVLRKIILFVHWLSWSGPRIGSWFRSPNLGLEHSLLKLDA